MRPRQRASLIVRLRDCAFRSNNVAARTGRLVTAFCDGAHDDRILTNRSPHPPTRVDPTSARAPKYRMPSTVIGLLKEPPLNYGRGAVSLTSSMFGWD